MKPYDRDKPPGSEPSQALVRYRSRRNEELAPVPPVDVIEPSRVDVSGASGDHELIRIWLQSKKSKHTRRAYGQDAGNFLAFLAQGRKSLRTATVGDMTDYLEQLAGAPASRARRLSAAKSLLTFGQKTGYLPFNVGTLVPSPPIPDHLAERILSEEEVTELLKAADKNRHGGIVRFIYATGARVSEAVRVRWEEVHPLKEGGARITLYGKGGKTRFVTISDPYYQKILATRGEATGKDFVFHTGPKNSLHPSQAYKLVVKAAELANIDKSVSTHWLRHAHASHALEHSASPVVVRDTLGHKSLDTTNRYAHVRGGDSSGKYLKVI